MFPQTKAVSLQTCPERQYRTNHGSSNYSKQKAAGRRGTTCLDCHSDVQAGGGGVQGLVRFGEVIVCIDLFFFTLQLLWHYQEQIYTDNDFAKSDKSLDDIVAKIKR